MVVLHPMFAYGIGVFSRFIRNPGKEHWEAVKWILRYLNGTTNNGILFGGINNTQVKS